MWQRLEKWQRNIDAKMTQEKYLEICEQIGEEPDPERMPPDFEDFPHDVRQAIIIFGKLQDKIVPDIGYLGKDYSSLPLHMEVANIENKDIFLETIVRLDQKVIEKTSEEVKRKRKQLEKK